MIPAVLLLLLVWTTSAFAATAGSAILALRTVANQPYAADARIVELRGERADPMPAEWRILLADPSARGGVREVSVANGAITSERTPLKGFQNVAEMAAIQTSQVSLDSSDLLQSVREQANEARVAFHWLDYTLRTDASTRKPVWTIRLYDDLGALVGTMGVRGSPAFPCRRLRRGRRHCPIPSNAGRLAFEKISEQKSRRPPWKNRRLHGIHRPQGR